jgi:hypothetical protein
VRSYQNVAERQLQILDMLRSFRDNLPQQYWGRLEQSTARWHFKIISALAYGARVLAQPDVPRGELLLAVGWAAQNQVA